MTDRWLYIPLGLVENLVVQVESFTIPSDFVVLEMDNAGEILLILVQPFLVMTQANINITNGTVTLTMEGNDLEFDLHGVM